MRRMWLGNALLWMGLAATALSGVQEHPPISAEATETPAKKLQEDLAAGKKVLVIDVRGPKEYAAGHVPGAINVPIEDLAKRIAAMKLVKDITIVTVCEHGGRSSRAAVELQKLGFKTSSFCTLDSWKKQGYKVEKGDEKPASISTIHKFTCHHYCQSDKEVADLNEQCDCACAKPYRECMKGD